MADCSGFLPVVLAGGKGLRLWPLSTAEKPKQFCDVTGGGVLLRETLRRIGSEVHCSAPIVTGNVRHRKLIEEALAIEGISPECLMLEPVALDTCAAIVLSALVCSDPDRILLVLPADHVLGDARAFFDAAGDHRELALQGHVVLFGIRPSRAEPGYGYIAGGELLSGQARRVSKFIEKPDATTAARLIAGGCLWNSGVFMFAARTVLQEAGRLEPDLVRACRNALAGGLRDGHAVLPGIAALSGLPARSIDRAVMERTGKAVVVAIDALWSDVGSWPEVWSLSKKDAHGNVVLGAVDARNCRNCYLRNDGPPAVIEGLDGVAIVRTEAGLLVRRL